MTDQPLLVAKQRPSLLLVLSKFRYRILFTFLVGIVLAIFYASRQFHAYKSEARILIRASHAENISLAQGSTVRSGRSSAEDFIGIQLNFMQSRDLHEKYVAALIEAGLLPRQMSPGQETAQRKLRKKLASVLDSVTGTQTPMEVPLSEEEAYLNRSVSMVNGMLVAIRQRKAPIIVLQLTHPNRVYAQKALEVFLEVYEESRRDWYTLKPAISAARAEAETSRLSYEVLNEEWTTFRQASMPETLDADIALVEKVLARIKNQQVEIRIRMPAARMKERVLLGFLSDTVEWGAGESAPTVNPDWLFWENLRKTKTLDLKSMEKIEPTGSSKLVQLMAEIEYCVEMVGKEKQFSRPQTKERNSRWQELINEVQAVKIDLAVDEKTLAELGETLKKYEPRRELLEQRRLECQVLQARMALSMSDLDDKNEVVTKLRREEAREQQQALANQKVIQRPTLGLRPIGRSRASALILALMAVFGATIGVAVLSAILDHGFSTPAELSQAVGTPTVAAIPDLNSRRQVKTALARMSNLNEPTPTADVARSLEDVVSILTDATRKVGGVTSFAPFAQLFRIADSIVEDEFVAEGVGCRAVVVSSVSRGEGATLSSLSLAIALADRIGGRVLVVDADADKMGLAKAMERANKGKRGTKTDKRRRKARSLPSMSWNEAEVCQTAHENIDVMVSSSRNSQAKGGSCTNALQAYAESYDAIVFDSGPLMHSAATQRLVRMGVPMVLVVKANSTNSSGLSECVSMVGRYGGRIIGAILNHRRYFLPKWSKAES
ncbi:MAG: hypothetical protein V3W41_04150 [Planctomycetota bacterium]